MSHFDDIREIVPVRIWDGVVARAWSGEQAALSVIDLHPDVHVPEHSHPNEQTGLVLQGTATFRIGDETKELRAGSTWVIPSNVPHEVVAGPGGAVIVELFAPPRSDWADLERLDPAPPPGF